MKNKYILIIVALLAFFAAYAQQIKETIIKVEIENAQTRDNEAVGRTINAQKRLQIRTSTVAQSDTIYLNIPIEPTITETEYYKVKMIIDTPASETESVQDTTLLIPIKGK